MKPHVHLKAAHGGEIGRADVARVVPLATMGAAVSVEGRLDREAFVAHFTGEGPLPSVDSHMAG